MSTPFVVDLEALQRVIDRLASFEAFAEERTGDVDTRVSRLHLSWSGHAAAAHRDAHTEWMRGAREMRDGVAAMRSAASTAHGNYGSAVSANLTMWT